MSVACIGVPELSFEIRGAERFPMASTFKVPLAVVLLRLEDAGAIRLSDEVEVQLADARPGTGVVTSHLMASGPSKFTVGSLLELALTESDNTAADILLDMVGGPARVTAHMKELGLPTILVCRSCLQHISQRLGIDYLPEDRAKMPDFVAMLERRMELPLGDLRAADEAFDFDERDTTTPRDMARLLVLIWERQAGLSEQSTRTLLDIMARCKTGADRIPGRLPAHMQRSGGVMHKTGSLGGRTNDVGLLALPNGRVLALSAYVMGGPCPGGQSQREVYAERERAIADLARACYDFFLLVDG